MTTQIWVLVILGIFVTSLIGQIIRGRRRPWILPTVAALGLALCVFVFYRVFLATAERVGLEAVKRAIERNR